MFDPSMLSLATLPSMSLEDRALLPNVPAIYFALGPGGAVLYVGRTKCLCLRWLRHEKWLDFVQLGAARIAWMVIDALETLPKLEELCIHYFRPPLNESIVVRAQLLRIEKAVSVLPDDSPKTLGGRLKHERHRKRLTQQELAERAKVSQPLIARLEKDQIQEPSAKPLGRIARALGCSLDWLIGMYEDDPHDASLLIPAHSSG